MTAATRSLAQRLAQLLAEVGELARTEPAAADRLVQALVSHIRSWKPESVSPLGTLPPPTDPGAIRDPRGPR